MGAKKKYKYNVYSLGRDKYVGRTDDEHEAWEIIGTEIGLFQCYEVHDADGRIVAEFIPY